MEMKDTKKDDELKKEWKENTSEAEGGKKKRKLPLWSKIVMAILAAVLLMGGAAYAAFHYYYHQMNIVSDEDEVVQQEETFDEDENTANLKEVDPSSIQLDSATQADQTSEVINILICGEEAIHDDRGRTDSIMIATINRKDNRLSLTSIMRDTYVKIPGFSDNKINAAYHNGGMKTLVATVKENFGIAVDGYVLVNFDSFEQIIDAIGGIDIELSEEEVKYLNSTNYISNTAYHTLTVGVNHLNGNQALGYARVRYVNKDGNAGDFARTLRHRTVMTAIYKKMMSKSTLDLVAMLPKILPLLTTNIKKADLIDYLTAGVAVRDKNSKLKTLNVPVEGCYKITRVRGMSVVLASPLDENVKKMQKFIYGSALEDKEEMDSEAHITVGQ
jgi:LCP family protein required for cell wall assembly